jgi:glycerate 2-kinase
MRVLIAADKFKGSLTAPEACDAIALGILDVRPDATIDLCPMSDGGEGFVDAMTRSRSGTKVTCRVTGPLPEQHVEATFAIVDGHTAVIEMSAASGLALLPPADRNPLYTTSFGTGELIHHAVDLGCRTILLGIGGSATCDAGVGCLQACGCHVVTSDHQYASITEPLCGRDLDDITFIKSHRGSRVDGVKIDIACDVTNPLFGPNGAARVFAPQKGASPDDVEMLDRMLTSLSRRVGWDVIALRPGSGAAGGIGCGLAAMFGATLRSGVELVIDATNLAERITAADLIITGEGRLDATSLGGKVIGGVARLCCELGKPCAAIVGDVDRSIDVSTFHLSSLARLLRDGEPLADSMTNAAERLRDRARTLVPSPP